MCERGTESSRAVTVITIMLEALSNIKHWHQEKERKKTKQCWHKHAENDEKYSVACYQLSWCHTVSMVDGL